MRRIVRGAIHLFLFTTLTSTLAATFALPDIAVSEEAGNTLSLDQAIDYALGNNPGLMASESSIQITKSRIKSAKSRYFPQASFKLIFPFIGRESGGFIDQLIWDFGRTNNLIKSSKANLKAAQYDFKSDRSETVYNIRVAFYNALSDKHTWGATKALIEEKELRLARAQGLFELGQVSKIEVTDAELKLGYARLEMLASTNSMESNRIELARLMGYEDGFDFELLDELEFKMVALNVDEAIKIALASRPELKSLEAREIAKIASLKATSGDYYPTIVGRTAYRFDGEGATGPDFIGGVGVKIPIFSGFDKLAKLREARAKLGRTRAEIVSLKQRIATEIRQLYLTLSYALESIEVTKTLTSSSEEKYELVNEKYDVGRSSEVELAAARAELAINKAKQIENIYDYKITVAKLERGTGDKL